MSNEPMPTEELSRALDAAYRSLGPNAAEELMGNPTPFIRATPARVHKPLRLRVCLSYDGPPWLSLLTQCAWLRGGIIGERVVPQPTS